MIGRAGKWIEDLVEPGAAHAFECTLDPRVELVDRGVHYDAVAAASGSGGSIM